MKRILFGSTMLVVFISCSKSPEEQAQDNIEKYLILKLDDPKSYEVVTFGKLEKERSSYTDDPKYSKLLAVYVDISKKADNAFNIAISMTQQNTIESARKSYENLLNSQESTLKDITDFEKEYKPIEIFKMKHSFRAKNKTGATVLDSTVVILDTNFKVINLKINQDIRI